MGLLIYLLIYLSTSPPIIYYREREIYYRELAHEDMEVGKSQDLQDESASSRPGTAYNEAPSESEA